MKQVKLKSLTLVNFKGHKDLTVNFDQETRISGDNATGKSTVFDSFVWMLFGKDQFDRKDFEIIPTFDNKRLDKVDSEVIAHIEIDGSEITLKRVLHQKWVRRRGTSEEVFDGCETLYYINNVPKKAGEYKAFVETIADESVFKLITNPSAFLALHWTKQREFLFEIAGNVSDTEVANSDPRFAALLELINGKSLVDFKKELSARKKKLKDDLENIQPKIDQTTRLMPEQKDFQSIESELRLTEEFISAIDLQISDKAAAIRGQYDEIQEKQKQISDLKTKQNEVVNSKRTEASKLAFDSNQKRTETENEISVAKRSIENTLNDIKSSESMIIETKRLIGVKEQELIELREEWSAENKKEYVTKDGCLICPAFNHECGDKTAHDKQSEFEKNAKQAFFESKQKKLNDINSEGLAKSTNLEGLKNRLTEINNDLKNSNDSLLLLESNVDRYQKTLLTTPIEHPKLVIASELPEWQELERQIKGIEATIGEVKPVDNSELNEKKSELLATRDQLKQDLSSRDLIAKYKAEIKSLEKQGSELAQQIADTEKQEFTIDEFNRVKIDECDRRVNGLFEIVKFKLFDKTNDGNEFESCIAINKAGVPIAATNTAERINAGIDIIRTLSKFYNVAAPIFVESSESVNTILNANSQMILLRVTEEPILTIS